MKKRQSVYNKTRTRGQNRYQGKCNTKTQRKAKGSKKNRACWFFYIWRSLGHQRINNPLFHHRNNNIQQATLNSGSRLFSFHPPVFQCKPSAERTICSMETTMGLSSGCKGTTFLNPPIFRGIDLQKIFKVNHKSPFTECGLY